MSKMAFAMDHNRPRSFRDPKLQHGRLERRGRFRSIFRAPVLAVCAGTALNWSIVQISRSREVGEAANGEEKTFKSKDDLQQHRAQSVQARRYMMRAWPISFIPLQRRSRQLVLRETWALRSETSLKPENHSPGPNFVYECFKTR